MKRRVEPFETYTHKTFVLESGRTVYVYPLSREEMLLPLKQIAKSLQTDIEGIFGLASLSETTESAFDAANGITNLQSAALTSYAFFGLALDDPDYVFEAQPPAAPLMASPDEWYQYALKISSECMSRLGKMTYTDRDREGIIKIASNAMKDDVEQEKKA